MERCKNAMDHPRDEKRVTCILGLFGGQPALEDCEVCSQYSGPSRGLGDTVANVFKKTGVTKVVETVTGNKDCGCNKRRAALNKRFPKDKTDA